ncbi:hypothetical protein ACFE04_002070 [Oxalis oulophora]
MIIEDEEIDQEMHDGSLVEQVGQETCVDILVEQVISEVHSSFPIKQVEEGEVDDIVADKVEEYHDHHRPLLVSAFDIKDLPMSVANKQVEKLFTFDKQAIYNQAIVPIVNEVFDGFNCTLFAYGHSSTGKTYTMEGGMRNKGGDLPAEATELDNWIMATIIMDSAKVVVLDVRFLTLPLPVEGGLDPILAYNAGAEIEQLQWSSSQPNWVVIAFSTKLQILRI